MVIEEKPMQYRNLHKTLLYNTFVETLMIEQNERMTDEMNITTDNIVEVHNETTIIQKNFSENRFRSTSRDQNHYDRRITPQNYTRSRYDNYRQDSRSYRSPYRTHRSPYRRVSRPRYRSRSYSRDNNFTKFSSSYRPPSRLRDSRYCISSAHSNTRNNLNRVQTQSIRDPLEFEVHMYHPTEMANALIPTSWFYSLYLHTS